MTKYYFVMNNMKYSGVVNFSTSLSVLCFFLKMKFMMLNIVNSLFNKLSFCNTGFGVWGLGFGVWGLGDRKSVV